MHLSTVFLFIIRKLRTTGLVTFPLNLAFYLGACLVEVPRIAVVSRMKSAPPGWLVLSFCGVLACFVHALFVGLSYRTRSPFYGEGIFFDFSFRIPETKKYFHSGMG